jgi:hypothetical protein
MIVARSRPRVQIDRRAVLGGACAALLVSAACASAQGGDVRVVRAGPARAPRVGHAWVRVLAPAPLVFEVPTGLDVQPDGALLVVEFDRRRLLRVVPSSGRVTQIATFGKPWGVARGPTGSTYVSTQTWCSGSIRVTRP